jgi:hypothetical protein
MCNSAVAHFALTRRTILQLPEEREHGRQEDAAFSNRSAPRGGLYQTSSGTQYRERRLRPLAGIPPDGRARRRRSVPAEGWPGLAAFNRECLAVLGARIIHADEPVAARKTVHA